MLLPQIAAGGGKNVRVELAGQTGFIKPVDQGHPNKPSLTKCQLA